MPPSLESWNSLEVVKLLIGVLTPLSVAAFGWFISHRLKRFELMQWSNQKLVEKRLTLYDFLAPRLNKLLCFYTWIGDWKDISPQDVVKTKRDLDQSMYISGISSTTTCTTAISLSFICCLSHLHGAGTTQKSARSSKAQMEIAGLIAATNGIQNGK